jgi:Flp pilus assembly protein TadD
MKALQLDDGLAEAHTSLGMVALYYEWDWRQAGQQFRRAIDLNPNYPQAHAWDSLYFGAMGEVPQALQQALWAQQLDPLSLVMNMDLGSVYYWSRQYDEAVNTYRYAISLDPYFARAHSRLGMVLAVQRDYPGAIHEFEEARKLSGPDPYIDGLIGYAQALSGNQKAARRLLAKLTERSHHEYVPAFSLALLCLGLGDRARAMDWFERAYQDRSTYMIYAKVDPLLDPLRSDQRFVSLLEQMDLKELGTPNKLAKTSDPPTRIIDVAMR